MMTLSIDLETYSGQSLTTGGVYRYAESDDFEILLFAYAEDDKPVRVVDVAGGEEIPEEILSAVMDDNVIKTAFNAVFERVCLSYWLKRKGLIEGFLNPVSWRCSMIWCAYMGLPQSLADAGKIMGLDVQKMTEGKELIKYFCVPCRPTKANGQRTRNLSEHAPEKWELFKKYNARDVEVEIAIKERLKGFPVPDSIWAEYCLDQIINDRGILIDMELVQNAISMDGLMQKELVDKIQALTEIDNPNSVQQIRAWLATKDFAMESLGKKEVAEAIKTAPLEIAEVLRFRQQLARTSVKKYTAMENAVNRDNRARGMFRFYGAGRTGRFSGARIQLQNLVRNSMTDLREARELVRQGNFDAMKLLYDDIPDTLSQLIRTALIPRVGRKFVVADFSAIEARVLAWIAGEKWVLDTFLEGGDIYCATASRMFHCRVEKHGENGELRQKGKQCVLGCGYGGSVGALKAMGAIEAGMKEEELQPMVDYWRAANPNIVKLWYAVDRCAKKAVMDKSVASTNGIAFSCRSGLLLIKLPSGRTLSYAKPRMGINRFGSESVTYEGVGTAKKWERIETFGGKLVENIVQAVARDILMYAMGTLSRYDIVAHVHDEIIIEAERDADVKTVCEEMGRTPPWAEGLPLSADGYECYFYMKD